MWGLLESYMLAPARQPKKGNFTTYCSVSKTAKLLCCRRDGCTTHPCNTTDCGSWLLWRTDYSLSEQVSSRNSPGRVIKVVLNTKTSLQTLVWLSWFAYKEQQPLVLLASGSAASCGGSYYSFLLSKQNTYTKSSHVSIVFSFQYNRTTTQKLQLRVVSITAADISERDSSVSPAKLCHTCLFNIPFSMQRCHYCVFPAVLRAGCDCLLSIHLLYQHSNWKRCSHCQAACRLLQLTTSLLNHHSDISSKPGRILSRQVQTSLDQLKGFVDQNKYLSQKKTLQHVVFSGKSWEKLCTNTIKQI